MKERRSIWFVLALVALMFLLVLQSACGSGQKTTDSPVPSPERTEQAAIASTDVTAGNNGTLKIALYKQVPSEAAFQTAIEEAWERRGTGEKLEFVDWECYATLDPGDIDVFVYDAVYADYYLQKGWILPFASSDIDEAEDILPFALDAAKCDGGYAGIPQLLCTELLFYRAGDEELAAVNSIDELYTALGDYDGDVAEPMSEENKGLLIDASAPSVEVCRYMDSHIDLIGKQELADSMPSDNSAQAAIDKLKKMAGEAQASYIDPDGDIYKRAEWFAEGSGRAYIGYSESMSRMYALLGEANFKQIAYGGKTNVPLYFCDIIGMNAKVAGTWKEAPAKLLANIAAGGTSLAEIIENNGAGTPGFLLPARTSLYDALMEKYPVYEKLSELVTNPSNVVLKYTAAMVESINS